MTLPGFVSLRMTDFPEWNWDLSVGIWPLIVSYSLIDSVLAPGENIYRITSEKGKKKKKKKHQQKQSHSRDNWFRMLETQKLEKGVEKEPWKHQKKKLI